MVAAALAALAVARAASIVACAATAAVWRAAAAALKVSIWALNAARAATRSALVVSTANEAVVEVSAKPAISRAATAVRVFFMISLSVCAGWMPLLIGTYCAATFRNLCDDFAKSVRVYSWATQLHRLIGLWWGVANSISVVPRPI